MILPCDDFLVTSSPNSNDTQVLLMTQMGAPDGMLFG
jgi:hypothetical protein